MKGLAIIWTIAIAIALTAGQALAFSCPKLVKAADESIAKAEAAAGKISGDREKGRAMAMIAVAKDLNKQATADHQQAVDKKSAELHYRAEAKAKAAKALADQVK